MSEENVEDVNPNVEMSDQTIELEVTLSDFHMGIVEQLEESGADVESVVSQQLQANVEEVIHKLYQDARYQQR